MSIENLQSLARIAKGLPSGELIHEDVWRSVECDLGCVGPSLDETLIEVEDTLSVLGDGPIQHFIILL